MGGEADEGLVSVVTAEELRHFDHAGAEGKINHGIVYEHDGMVLGGEVINAVALVFIPILFRVEAGEVMADPVLIGHLTGIPSPASAPQHNGSAAFNQPSEQVSRTGPKPITTDGADERAVDIEDPRHRIHSFTRRPHTRRNILTYLPLQ